MEANNNKEFIFKKCQAYKEDFPEIQKDLNIFLNFKGILKYPIESPIDQKIDNQSMLFIIHRSFVHCGFWEVLHNGLITSHMSLMDIWRSLLVTIFPTSVHFRHFPITKM